MSKFFKRFLPDRDRLGNTWGLRWLGPALKHPRLWHVSRRGIAVGLALGIFFGLLIPIAQIPFSATFAVLLRANVPTAVASTLVTNPVTFGPIYYLAYQVGAAILGEELEPPAPPSVVADTPTPETPASSSLASLWDKITGVGKPLVLGLAIFAVVGGVGAYLLVSWIWRLRIWWAWRQRSRRRRGML
ncbi:DUF2062 domain-containing protein [Azovibrio restrictus]|jgi:uncharacterized protein (DUF2062 family)|uniref:DUF2062 domain-containing protein n=1 Tax=Azovibrio restrictus TaxID=146938 RepID=UPI0026EB50F0|nr:DUF2062 domain-containing protein [Azovibrio restrictus]